MIAAICHYRIVAHHRVGERSVCTISRFLTERDLNMAEAINAAQPSERGPGVDVVKAASGLDEAYRIISEVGDDLDTNPGPAAAAAANTKLGSAFNLLRGVSRGAHVMCGTADELADVVDSGVLMHYVVLCRLGNPNLPKPVIHVARAGIVLTRTYCWGVIHGYW